MPNQYSTLKVITPRMLARMLEQQTYIGKPCPRGHRKRYTSSSNCCECTHQRNVANRDYFSAYAVMRRQRKRDHVNAIRRAYYYRNHEKCLESHRDWLKNNRQYIRDYNSTRSRERIALRNETIRILYYSPKEDES